MPCLNKKFKILKNQKVASSLYKMTLETKASFKKARPGQFVQLKIADGMEPFFRRPLSIHRNKEDLQLFYQIVGRGTERLSRKTKGDTLDVFGPLGNSFSLPPAETQQIVFVAGSIGIAPLLALSDFLKAKGFRNITLLYGAKSRGLVFDMKEYEKNGCKVHVATEDGSLGAKGYVDKLFSQIDTKCKETFIYTCGPTPMIQSVQRYAQRNDFPGEASCEEVMACGTGACLGCVIRTISGYKTVCHDGPVFDLHELNME